MIVVIPSNREINFEYLTPLIDSGARFIIVDDSEGTISIEHPQFEVYNWGDRRKMLGDLDMGFPRNNGASRDFGFYIAWRTAEPDEIVVALDDDCEVYHQDFADRVAIALSEQRRPTATCKGQHLNILSLFEDVSDTLYPRGFPYSSRVENDPVEIVGTSSTHPKFCLGLWKNIFDVNAIDKIRGPIYKHPEASLKCPSVSIASGKLISVCSMNMIFRAELIPAIYQLPMHVTVMPGWVIDRYGDIWGGFILKTLMDINGDQMTVGEPMINHLKEGDYARNIWQEHVCHLVNDEFINFLNLAREEISPGSYLSMMKQLNALFQRYENQYSAILRPYMSHLCQAMKLWNMALTQAKHG